MPDEKESLLIKSKRAYGSTVDVLRKGVATTFNWGLRLVNPITLIISKTPLKSKLNTQRDVISAKRDSKSKISAYGASIPDAELKFGGRGQNSINVAKSTFDSSNLGAYFKNDMHEQMKNFLAQDRTDDEIKQKIKGMLKDYEKNSFIDESKLFHLAKAQQVLAKYDGLLSYKDGALVVELDLNNKSRDEIQKMVTDVMNAMGVKLTKSELAVKVDKLMGSASGIETNMPTIPFSKASNVDKSQNESSKDEVGAGSKTSSIGDQIGAGTKALNLNDEVSAGSRTSSIGDQIGAVTAASRIDDQIGAVTAASRIDDQIGAGSELSIGDKVSAGRENLQQRDVHTADSESEYISSLPSSSSGEDLLEPSSVLDVQTNALKAMAEKYTGSTKTSSDANKLLMNQVDDIVKESSINNKPDQLSQAKAQQTVSRGLGR